MSVTFSLPQGFEHIDEDARRFVLSLPCPACGGQSPYAGLESPTPASEDCGVCYGYGGDSAAEDRWMARRSDVDGEFNVANGNAAYIVQDILNLSSDRAYYGSIDPSLALRRLEAACAFAPSGVREPSERRQVNLSMEGVSEGPLVIDCGRSLRQVDSYFARLRRLAEIAIERGAPSIVWA